MLTDQDTLVTAATEEPFRYTRSEIVSLLHTPLDAERPASSARQAARDAGVPHTTWRYWQQRQQDFHAAPEAVVFFESPAGLAFLKRLLLALHLVFQQQGTVGIRPLCRFLELAQLAPFVASSYGTHQHLAALLQELLGQYDQQQRQQLAPRMAAKQITLCEDENFHGDQPCLVAMEPVSNFLVVEVYRPQRDADTWTSVVDTALEGLPVTVVQVTSDLAKGLQSHARDGLAAQHSPDLMHVQADLHKATSLPLHRHLEAARQQLARAQKEVEHWKQRCRQYQAGPRPPGRPADFAQRIAWAQYLADYWEKQVEQRQQRQQQVSEAVRGLGDDYHPFDAQTGQAVSVEQMQQRLQQRVQTVERLAAQAEVSEAGREKIAKARRVLPRLLASLAWFWHSLRLLVEALELPEAAENAVYQDLLPGLYWSAAAERARTAEDRKLLRRLATACLERAWAKEGVLSSLDKPQQEVIRRTCAEGVNRFVRSSSCVEGRNGQLSLHHHSYHGFSPGKLTGHPEH